MKKKTLLITVLLLVIFGVIATGIFAYFNISKDNQAVTVEQTEEPETTSENSATANSKATSKVVLSGKFVDGDAIHKGEGRAEVVETDGKAKLKFKNFSVTKGPDVFVYLSPNAADEELGEFVSLGKIKSFNGDQSYNLPENYDDYKTVVIWCRAFSTTFATAELK